MNLKLRTIETRAEAQGLADLIGLGARETLRAVTEDAAPDGVEGRYLETFEEPESVLVVAQGDEGPVALAASAPFVDPLTAERRPMLVILYVDRAVRHHGVARALVRELRRRLGARGQGVLLARAAHNDDVVISMGERWGLVRTWELMSSE
jgi:GNAT superfamily N-acetyltransferase